MKHGTESWVCIKFWSLLSWKWPPFPAFNQKCIAQNLMYICVYLMAPRQNTGRPYCHFAFGFTHGVRITIVSFLLLDMWMSLNDLFESYSFLAWSHHAGKQSYWNWFCLMFKHVVSSGLEDPWCRQELSTLFEAFVHSKFPSFTTVHPGQRWHGVTSLGRHGMMCGGAGTREHDPKIEVEGHDATI